MFASAGFAAKISANIDGWMFGHTAFVVPIGFALYRLGGNPTALSADPTTLRLMVRATREAFEALDDPEIPANLRWLYVRMPTAFAVRYWRRVLASPRGELWFGAHSSCRTRRDARARPRAAGGHPTNRSADAALGHFGTRSITGGFSQPASQWRCACARFSASRSAPELRQDES